MKVLRLFSSWSSDFKIRSICTARKVSKYGVISGPYFPLFGLNTEKYGPEIIPYLDTFHAVMVSIRHSKKINHSTQKSIPHTALGIILDKVTHRV